MFNNLRIIQIEIYQFALQVYVENIVIFAILA